MKVRRSLVGTLLCTQALFACYSPDAGENIATESQAFSYQFAGTLSGTRSAGSAYASRGPGLLDLFYLNDVAYPTFPNTVSYRRYVDGLGWVSPTFTLGRPNGWPVDIAATANGGRIDLFVATQDGNVYHRASSVAQGTAAPTWPTGWVQVSGVTAKSPSSGDSITVSSWGPGRLDLYWITPSGNIGHKIAENNAWVATETGDTPETWWLQPSGGTNAYSPPIESASPMVGHLDIVLRTASGTLNHHFWDVDHWDKTALTCCQRPDGVAFSLGDFVLARSGHLSDFHLYAQDYLGSVGGQGQTVLERLVHDGSWNMPGGIVRAMDSSNAFVAVPGSVLLNEGLRWHNEERLDIIGWRNMPGTNDDPAWRFFF
jgi:hypothetical protein